MSLTPVVAIVGRPNVGKSSLFNRLIRARRSLVLDTPGVTRDRIYGKAELRGEQIDLECVLVDTGGFDPGAKDIVMRQVLEQTELAIDEADAIIFLLDGSSGLMPEDHDVAEMLRRSGKAVIAAVNKIDGTPQEALVGDFYRLGLPEIMPISASHGNYVRDLQEEVVAALQKLGFEPKAEDDFRSRDLDDEEEEEGEFNRESLDEEEQILEPIRIALIGRPNVGKSSLINRLLGEDRHLVSEVAGTTSDSVDSAVEFQGQPYLLIDTAGIRRKRSIAHRVERFSVFAAIRGLESAHVTLLLLDANQPIAHQDARVAQYAAEAGRAVIIIVSKWDLKQKDTKRVEFEDKIRQELKYLNYAPIIFTSAFTGMGVEPLLKKAKKVYAEYCRRIPTGELNRFVKRLMDENPPPTKKGKPGKIYYMTQVGRRPPRFVASVNNPDLIHFSYQRYLVNAFRKAYDFTGSPLVVYFRARDKEERRPKYREKGARDRAKDPRKKATDQKRRNKRNKKS